VTRSDGRGDGPRPRYHRRETLASGRFAVIVNEAGSEFSLVLWRPEVERMGGREIGVTMRGKTVEWQMALDRGPAID
jgi:hypothetical protein